MSKASEIKSSRLVADPCVTVSDLTAAFSAWLQVNLSKDLYGLLQPGHGKSFSWKTSPDHQWLSDLAPLYLGLAQVAPNTILTSKKLVLVFENMQKDGLINNTSKMCDSTFHEWCDQTVRILFSKYRELKKDPAARARISKRCTSKQNSAIDAVLAVIKVAEITEDKQTKSAVTLSPPKSWGSWQTMVASGSITNNPASCATPTSSNKAAATPTQPTAEDYGLPPCCNIFRTILQQDEPQQETLQQPKTSIAAAPAILGSPNPSKSKRRNASWKMAERTPPDAKAAVASPCADVDISDDKIFQKTMSQAKAAANAKGSGIKPKAKAAPQAKKNTKPSSKSTPKSSIAKHAGTYELKKAASRAYHKAFTAAVQSGSDNAAAKASARQAYKKAVDDWETSH